MRKLTLTLHKSSDGADIMHIGGNLIRPKWPRKNTHISVKTKRCYPTSNTVTLHNFNVSVNCLFGFVLNLVLVSFFCLFLLLLNLNLKIVWSKEG